MACLHANALREIAVAADRAALDITISSAMLSLGEDLRAMADAAAHAASAVLARWSLR